MLPIVEELSAKINNTPVAPETTLEDLTFPQLIVTHRSLALEARSAIRIDIVSSPAVSMSSRILGNTTFVRPSVIRGAEAVRSAKIEMCEAARGS